MTFFCKIPTIYNKLSNMFDFILKKERFSLYYFAYTTMIFLGDAPSVEKPYGPYPFYVTNRNNKTVPILQAYAYTKYIGKVDLKFDSDGELISINGSPILLNHEKQQGK